MVKVEPSRDSWCFQFVTNPDTQMKLEHLVMGSK
ncbi:hypothetical protein P3T16_006749 [Paraburkholderia sp. GAS42]